MKLIATLLFVSIASAIFAGAPSPIDWQNKHLQSSKAAQIQQLNDDHEHANLLNQIYDQQFVIKTLYQDNQRLRENPKTVVEIKTVEKDVMPWWVPPAIFLAGCFGVLAQ